MSHTLANPDHGVKKAAKESPLTEASERTTERTVPAESTDRDDVRETTTPHLCDGEEWLYGGFVLSVSAPSRGLECKLGHGRIVLPAQEIDLLGEYVVGARLPGVDVGCSIGVWAGDPVLSVSLAMHSPASSRRTHGALLTAGTRGIRWALEIDQAVGLVEISTIGKGTAQAPWRRVAMLADKRSAQFIDVRMMISALEGEM